MAEWSLYLVRCSDHSLYTGIARDVDTRFSQHGGEKGAKYLRGKGPLSLVFQTPVGDRSEASKLEWRVKRLKKCQKEQLVEGSLRIEDLLA